MRPSFFLENLENRQMLTVTAQSQMFMDSFGPAVPNFSGNLSVSQFNSSTGTLLGADVSYSEGMSNSFSGTFTNQANSSGTATVDLNGNVQLSVPGVTAGNPTGATTNPQTVTVDATDTKPFAPFQTVTLAGSATGNNAKTLSLNGTDAATNGYVGTGNVLFPYAATGTFSENSTAGPAGNFNVSFSTTANVAVAVKYYYIQTGTISGLKFNDVNGNGVQDAGEGGLGGITINIVGTADEVDKAGGGVLLPSLPVSTSTTTSSVSGHVGEFSFANLRPGTYTITETVPNGQVQTFPGGGSYTITIAANGTATVGSLTGNNFGDFSPNPQIQIVKFANGEDTNCVQVPVGSTVTYTYNVTNPGNVPLSNITVKDDNATTGTTADDFSPNPVVVGGFNSGDTNHDNILQTTETWHYTYTVTALAGMHTNIATVTGTSPQQQQVTDTDDACYQGNAQVGATATMGFWQNKNGQAVIQSDPNIGNNLAALYPNLFGAGAPAYSTLTSGPVHFVNLSGQSSANVAAAFTYFFNQTGPKPYAQLMSNVLAAYFDANATGTSTKFGFNGNLLGTSITLSSSQASILGLPTSTTVGDYLNKVNSLLAGKNGVIPSSLFITVNDISDMINNLNHI